MTWFWIILELAACGTVVLLFVVFCVICGIICVKLWKDRNKENDDA